MRPRPLSDCCYLFEQMNFEDHILQSLVLSRENICGCKASKTGPDYGDLDVSLWQLVALSYRLMSRVKARHLWQVVRCQ